VTPDQSSAQTETTDETDASSTATSPKGVEKEHTVIEYDGSDLYVPNQNTDTRAALAITTGIATTTAGLLIVLAKRKKAFEAMGLTSDTKYIKKGETAFCVLDSFYDIDWKAWKAYYAGGEKPTLAKYPKDDLLILLDALQKAEEDPDVTNFVIDITANPGGSLDLVTTLTSLLADKTDIYAETTLTNQRYTATYVVDRNFDRVFDAKDKEVAYHLNIAVLTSAFSFSCGNLFPALMKGYGTLIIGEKSGGGACAIQQMCTADGFDYRISSFRCRLCDANGKNIDGGVEPQKALLRDQFYDLGVLEQNIVDYYHKK
jgi:hypothetical protein